MYDEGKGVPQDYTEAVKWYRLAAEHGYPDAKFNLGTMYGDGHGVPQDYVQAHMWFNLAAAQYADAKDRDRAAQARDFTATKMTPAQLAEAQKLAREWKPK
jgi:TPR repeat protein